MSRIDNPLMDLTEHADSGGARCLCPSCWFFALRERSSRDPCLSLPVLQLGLPDEFVEHGDPAKLMSLCGLDAAGIERLGMQVGIACASRLQ